MTDQYFTLRPYDSNYVNRVEDTDYYIGKFADGTWFASYCPDYTVNYEHSPRLALGYLRHGAWFSGGHKSKHSAKKAVIARLETALEAVNNGADYHEQDEDIQAEMHAIWNNSIGYNEEGLV